MAARERKHSTGYGTRMVAAALKSGGHEALIRRVKAGEFREGFNISTGIGGGLVTHWMPTVEKETEHRIAYLERYAETLTARGYTVELHTDGYMPALYIVGFNG